VSIQDSHKSLREGRDLKKSMLEDVMLRSRAGRSTLLPGHTLDVSSGLRRHANVVVLAQSKAQAQANEFDRTQIPGCTAPVAAVVDKGNIQSRGSGCQLDWLPSLNSAHTVLHAPNWQKFRRRFGSA
jgi:hypothetical protein